MRPNERNGPADERMPSRRASRSRRALRASPAVAGSGGANVAERDGLELGKDPGDLVVGGAERPKDQQLGLPGLREDQPLATACRDERSDGVGHGAGHGSAPVLAKDAREAIQDRGPVVGMVETDDLPAEVIEASVDERVIGLLVGFVVDRAVDEDRDLRALVDEVGAGLSRGDQLLRFVGKAAAFGDE